MFRCHEAVWPRAQPFSHLTSHFPTHTPWKKWLLFLSGFLSQEMHGEKGSHCLVMIQMSKCPLKLLHTFMTRHTDKSKTCVSPCRAFRYRGTLGRSGHSELELHSRWLNSRKAILLGIYVVEPLWEHLQLWRQDCPGLHARCRNILKAVKRHKILCWGQHLIFLPLSVKKPKPTKPQKYKERSTEDVM